MQKPKLNARVRQTTQDKLKEHAEQDGEKFSNHVDTVLTKHVENREGEKHQPKKEYGGK